MRRIVPGSNYLDIYDAERPVMMFDVFLYACVKRQSQRYARDS